MEAVTKRVAQQSEQTEDSKRRKHDCTGSSFPEMVKMAGLTDSVKLLCWITVLPLPVVQLQRAGCTVLVDEVAVEVNDPRELRRVLLHAAGAESSDSGVSLRKSAQQYLGSDAILLAALQPMSVLRPVGLHIHPEALKHVERTHSTRVSVGLA